MFYCFYDTKDLSSKMETLLDYSKKRKIALIYDSKEDKFTDTKSL